MKVFNSPATVLRPHYPCELPVGKGERTWGRSRGPHTPAPVGYHLRPESDSAYRFMPVHAAASLSFAYALRKKRKTRSAQGNPSSFSAVRSIQPSSLVVWEPECLVLWCLFEVSLSQSTTHACESLICHSRLADPTLGWHGNCQATGSNVMLIAI